MYILQEYQFLTAAKSNDVDTVKKMLAANVNINIGDVVSQPYHSFNNNNV